MGIFARLKAWVTPDYSIPPVSAQATHAHAVREAQAIELRAAIELRKQILEARIDDVTRQIEEALKVMP
jgi:hypothetical protein